MTEDKKTDVSIIQWFPGHMAKAQRMITAHVKLVDVVVELLDARIPASSANPAVQDIIGAKPRVVALNKADLADEEATRRWIARLRASGCPVMALDATTGRGVKELIASIMQLAAGKLDRMAAKGVQPRAVRAMILGIPNVGKSSLINRLLGAAKLKTADKPGVTRGQQWIKIGKNLELLDTPGVLWPKFEDAAVAFKLAATGAINDDIYDGDQVMLRLLAWLKEHHAGRLADRYKIVLPLPEDGGELLALIGARRGCLKSGGVVDTEKARRIVLTEFRSGKLGRFTLDHANL